jgi:hypothetical protein
MNPSRHRARRPEGRHGATGNTRRRHGRLYDEVEGIISASDFIEKTAGAQLLFI